MAIYLAVPLKKTFEVDLVKPLRAFIKDTYSSANAEDYEPALQEFNKLRNSMISKSADKHESSLEVLFRFVFVSLYSNPFLFTEFWQIISYVL